LLLETHANNLNDTFWTICTHQTNSSISSNNNATSNNCSLYHTKHHGHTAHDKTMNNTFAGVNEISDFTPCAAVCTV